MQAYLQEQEQRSSSMIKIDPTIGEVSRGTKPVLEPMPDVKPLPDGFRYKPDLANASAQALHFEQCIERGQAWRVMPRTQHRPVSISTTAMAIISSVTYS